MWQGGVWTDLTSPNAAGSVLGALGDQFVGSATAPGVSAHAMLWNGVSQNPVDLHPASSGAQYSQALATNGSDQVGFLTYQTPLPVDRAALWHGSAASWVNLHPSNFTYSQATAIHGDVQGGWVFSASTSYRAVLWNGSASSITHLNPAGANNSQVLGMTQGQQVGWAYIGFGQHAALWSGTAASFVDLNPPGHTSGLSATCGSAQVGRAFSSSGGGAAIWFGTAESFTPLWPYLPAGYGNSTATAIYQDGNTFYVAGAAVNSATGNLEAILWTGIPAPSTASLLAFAGIAAAKRRREKARY